MQEPELTPAHNPEPLVCKPTQQMLEGDLAAVDLDGIEDIMKIRKHWLFCNDNLQLARALGGVLGF